MLAALPEDPGLAPVIHIRHLITTCNFNFRGYVLVNFMTQARVILIEGTSVEKMP
jgi:predicted ATP-grasp superfamily ATP-dependent carboligase